MIPKLIHLCWLSGEPFPPLIQFCRDSWATYLPDYEVRLWDAAAVADMPAWVHEAISARKYAFAADYVRLYALYTEGGVYLDADVEITGRLDPYLGDISFMGRETGGDLEPALIGSEKGSEWLAACLDHYRDRHFLGSDGQLDQLPLPIVIEKVLRQRFGVDLSAIETATRFDALRLVVYPADRFSPKCRFTKAILRTDKTIAIHHFDGNWVDPSRTHSVKEAIHRLMIRTLGQRRYIEAKALLRRIRGA
jgi:hypothetical protein